MTIKGSGEGVFGEGLMEIEIGWRGCGNRN